MVVVLVRYRSASGCTFVHDVTTVQDVDRLLLAVSALAAVNGRDGQWEQVAAMMRLAAALGGARRRLAVQEAAQVSLEAVPS